MQLIYETRAETSTSLKNIEIENNNPKCNNAIDDIDIHHIFCAYKTIHDWVLKQGDSFNRDNFKSVFRQSVQVIWYEIDENDTTNPIDTFTRLNIGKIPLTNAELIKALFLRKGNFSESAGRWQIEIANEWDNMEYKLQDDAFWYFLTNGEQQKTFRIEFLFDVMCEIATECKENIGTDDYKTFRFFNNKFEQSKDDGKKNHAEKIWNEIMEMDFVYGSVEKENHKNKFLPLDGQQRLTTLWLLHWYVGVREKQTDLSFLENFTYETRTSSRDFCSTLFKEANIDFDSEKISSQIEDLYWFHASYKKDPTIQAMLNMLDAIHTQCKACEEIALFCRLDKLQFYPFVLNDFNLTDDLYIKMNARGKPLTNFENFKADLIGYIAEKAENDETWKKLLDSKNGIPIKMDTTWTDIFWKKRAEDNRIDEIYFAFFNRYVLNEFCCSAKNAEKCESEKIFKFLYGKSGDDSQVSYSVFGNYKWISLELLNKISNVLDRVYRLDEAQLAILNKFDFIPTYEKDVSLSTLTQARRVKFFAISAYFANGDFEETSFMRWMRVANNLIENADIDNVSNMISHIKLIDELSKGSHSIYEHLAAENFSVQSNASAEQLQEEIGKAKLILNDKSKWEKRIENLENHGYFTGQIRFIFDWLGNEPNATKFDECSKVMKKLFGNADVSDEIGKNGNHCFQRALLCFDENGNFGTWRGINYSFLLGKRDEFYSWKKFLLDKDRSQYLKLLVDEICRHHNCDVSAETLEKIINSYKSKIKNWRIFFIEYPDIWNYIENKNIRFYSEYNIDLVKRDRCGPELAHAELRSYCLYLDLKKQLSEYDTNFWERDNTCAYFAIINNDGKNIDLDIYFDVEKASEKESEDCYIVDVFDRDEEKFKFNHEDFKWNRECERYKSKYYSKTDVIKEIKEILHQLSQ